MSNTNITSDVNFDYKWVELAQVADFFTNTSESSYFTDIRLVDLYRYLQNPYGNIKQIRKASNYLANKHGVIRDIHRTIKSLPTLNYHLQWSSFEDVKKIKKYEQKVYKLLDDLNVKKLARDVLYEAPSEGTVVLCNRNNKYVQFLELDNIRIDKMVNGKWIVEYDLATIKSTNEYNTKAIIDALPDEITYSIYNQYVKKKSDEYRYVRLNNCRVISPDAKRNYPYGLPFSFGAWASLVQKEMINRVERSVSDRLIKQILILTAGNIGGQEGKPAPKELIEAYFKKISELVTKKDQNLKVNSDSEVSGTGVIAMPDFFKLDTLKVDTTMFTKDLYTKINNDIFMSLGVPSALIYGGGEGNFSMAQASISKLYSYIFTIVEEIEDVVNEYISSILPSSLQCKFYFDRTTSIDKDKYINQCKDFYMQTGIISGWAESLFGVPLHYVIGQAEYEKKVLQTENIIYPPKNAYTMSGDNQGGRPQSDNNNISDSGENTRTNGGNDLPSPSD